MKQRILDLLNDEVYDICEDFTMEEVADLVNDIVTKIQKRVTPYSISLCGQITANLGKYQFDVSQRLKGTVSCSDTEEVETAVSKTAYFPYYYDSEDPDAGLKNLIEMINESWYHCVNG